jgi:transcriptional regulator with XRE-family HTH domain
MTNTKYVKKNQQVPKHVADFFKATTDVPTRDYLIRELRFKHWTYEAVATACGITRERVRQIYTSEPLTGYVTIPFDIPEPPVKPERSKPVYIEPTPETLKRLLELQPYAQQVRSNGKKYREEAEEYTKLLNYSHTVEGVTLYRLAKRLGVTHGALRSRLARYGYKKPKTAKSKVYTPILEENRLN